MTDFENQLAQQGITLREWIDNEFWTALQTRDVYGNLRGLQATADDALKAEDAILRADANAPQKSVADTDAWVRRQSQHAIAVVEKNKKYAEWTAAELKMKILFAMKDKYQTDCKLARDMDNAHR